MKRFKKLNFSSIKETLESSSIHSIPNIIRNENYFIKILWLLCLIGSSSGCFWFILKSLNEFFEHDVISRIDIKHVSKLIFPIITICNLNLYSNEMSNNFIRNKFQNYYPDTEFFDTARVVTKSNKTHRHLFGKKIEDIIIKCTFKSQNCNLSQDFESYYDLRYGNCFRYNSGKNMLGEINEKKYSNNYGYFNSLSIELFIGSALTNDNVFSHENGYNIFISNEITDSLYQEGISILPGTINKIRMQKYTLIKIPKPYSECTNDLNSADSYHSESYKKLFELNMTKYHYKNCLLICFQRYLVRECECLYDYFTISPNYSVRKCLINLDLTKNDTKCIDEKWQIFISKDSLLNECDCPIECEYNEYFYSLSSSEYPTRNYYNYLINSSFFQKNYPNMSHIEMKQSISQIKLFYDDLRETVISQEIKIQLSDLISNIGGLLGLFLGILLNCFKYSIMVIKYFYNFRHEFLKLNRNRRNFNQTFFIKIIKLNS